MWLRRKRKPKKASDCPDLAIPKGPTVREEHDRERRFRHLIIASVRDDVFERDGACRICDGTRPTYLPDEMHEIVPRSALRGRPLHELFSTANCVRLCARCHRDVTEHRIRLDPYAPPTDGPNVGADVAMVVDGVAHATDHFSLWLATMAGQQTTPDPHGGEFADWTDGQLRKQMALAIHAGDYTEGDRLYAELDRRRQVRAHGGNAGPQPVPVVPPSLTSILSSTHAPQSMFATATVMLMPNAVTHSPPIHQGSQPRHDEAIVLRDAKGFELPYDRPIGSRGYPEQVEVTIGDGKFVVVFERTNQTDAHGRRVYRELDIREVDAPTGRAIVVEE